MNDTTHEDTQKELDLLKEQATRMGIPFHPNIGLDTLQAKIDSFSPDDVEKTTVETKDDTADEKQEPYELPDLPERVSKSKDEILRDKRLEATKLVRVRIACMNPNKKEWEGEILTVANSLVGTMKKYIPFNNDEGWHIPYMMYLHLKDRHCQIFIKKKNARGRTIAVPKMIKEFSVELLPELTAAEIKDLAQRQAMASGKESY